MQKIDRLGWTAGLSIYAYGLRIGIRVNAPEILEQLPQRLPPGWEPGCSPLVDQLYSLRVGASEPQGRVRSYTMLYAGLTRLARTMDTNEALQALEDHLQVYVAEWARNRVFVHAGVVAWQGQAIVLPGRSFTGKSTLVAALLKAGATYYSDEYAVLDGHGLVHPFGRPLSLRQPDGQKPRQFAAESLGGQTGAEPLPVGLVALVRYQEGSRWRPRDVSPGQAVLGLLNNAIAAEREPDMVLHTLEKVVTRTINLAGVRGEAEAAADALLNALEQGGREADVGIGPRSAA